MMTPSEIEEHGRNVRRKLTRVYNDSPYKNVQAIKDIFAAADDLCELVIAIAENLKAAQALPPPTVTVSVEQTLAKETE